MTKSSWQSYKNVVRRLGVRTSIRLVRTCVIAGTALVAWHGDAFAEDQKPTQASTSTQDAKSEVAFFNGSWKEAVAKARLEHKCIFLDAYASWCGPCKTMDREVFVNTAVADYLNRTFVAIRVDMEKGEGPELAKKLRSINGYPSLLFFNAEGQLNKTLLGDRSAEDFLQEAKLVVELK